MSSMCSWQAKKKSPICREAAWLVPPVCLHTKAVTDDQQGQAQGLKLGDRLTWDFSCSQTTFWSFAQERKHKRSNVEAWKSAALCFLGKTKTHFNSIKFTDELTGLNTKWLGGHLPYFSCNDDANFAVSQRQTCLDVVGIQQHRVCQTANPAATLFQTLRTMDLVTALPCYKILSYHYHTSYYYIVRCWYRYIHIMNSAPPGNDRM